jgi:membrane protein DedA with SNARE-associated domain
MNWWEQAAAATQALLDQYGLLAIALFVLIEEAGVPIPIPGDIVMLLAGVRVHQGQSNLWLVLVSLELASVLGASCLYALARRAGRTTVYRYGRFLHLTPARLDRTEAWLHRRGWVAVVLGRLLPGLRIVTAVACGVFGIRYRVFLPSMALGGLVYILVYVLLGYFFGPSVLRLLDDVHFPLPSLGSLVPLVVLVIWLVRARRGLAVEGLIPATAVETGVRLRSGAGAGAIAALGAALACNFLVQLVASLLPLVADPLVREITARLPPALAGTAFLALVLDLVVFVGIGIGWGTLYAARFERHLRSWPIPDALRGAVFALVPLAVILGLEGRGLIWGTALGWEAVVGLLAAQGVRYLLYGVLLGITCPIFLGTTSEGSPPEGQGDRFHDARLGGRTAAQTGRLGQSVRTRGEPVSTSP